MRSSLLAACCAAVLACLTAQPSHAQPAGLARGEYFCTGWSGEVLAGLGFIVTGPGRYTDVDGGNAGTFVVQGRRILFRGGHLDGVVADNLDETGHFTIQRVSCGPYR